MKTVNKVLLLVFSLVVCQLAGVIGSLFTTPAISTWYATLAKPSFNPPAWIFAPVWTLLFLLMGVALYLVLRGGMKKTLAKIAVIVFTGQLVLNVIWSVCFFYLKNPFFAFVEIIFLWLAILATIYFFAKINRVAAWLLVPYILWVSFAAFLNFNIWQLNPSPAAVACTEEAKLCSDGSAVGRSGPKCEFAACPVDANWKIFTDAKTGIVFQYPEKLATKYIDTAEWPPQVVLLDKPFSCVDLPAEASAQAGGGSEITPHGMNVQRVIGGQTYCVSTEAEGAAGSIYTTYSYAFARDNQTVVLTFTLRATQCANYDEPKKTECENERVAFNADDLARQIVPTIKVNNE
jgi:tryptophan-rich sensory protein